MERQSLSPVLVEVIGSALESVCDEMGETLVKSSYSPNIKERRDCTTGLFDAEGNTLAQAEHIPIHLGSLMGIVSAVLSRYELTEIHDGDTFIGNDPYEGGGTHLPDIVLITPIFIDGVLRAWATNLAHHADFANRGHAHIFQEGIRIPPIRFMRDGEFESDVLRLILTNMQVPSERIADFQAQVAANRLGVQRFIEICEKYGVDTVTEAGRELLDYTERKVRAGIEQIPDGVYQFADVFESNQTEGFIDISLALTVQGDTMDLVFEAPPQIDSSINLVQTALLATVYYAVKTVVGPDIPANAGLYRPITVEAPLGSILNCVPPAPVQARTQMCQRVVDLVHGALAQAVPERLIAASNGATSSTTFSGIDPRTGKFYVYLETIGGGYGGGACLDGLDGVQAHITNTSNLPVEGLEAEYPITVQSYELVNGSGGDGEHRGGMGIHRRVRMEHDGALCEVNVSRVTSAPWGLLGGGPGGQSHAEKNDGERLDEVKNWLDKGDELSIFTAGGGGYGPPQERSRDLVAQDVAEGRISLERAIAVYGFVPDPAEEG